MDGFMIGKLILMMMMFMLIIIDLDDDDGVYDRSHYF